MFEVKKINFKCKMSMNLIKKSSSVQQVEHNTLENKQGEFSAKMKTTEDVVREATQNLQEFDQLDPAATNWQSENFNKVQKGVETHGNERTEAETSTKIKSVMKSKNFITDHFDREVLREV